MLRQAEPGDAEAIERIRVAAWKAAYGRFVPNDFLDALSPTENLEGFRKHLSSQSLDFMLSVAQERGTVVAFSIVGRPRYEASIGTIELWARNVLPEFWRQGIGSSLVTRAISFSTQAGFKKIELWCLDGNVPTPKAYEKLGFVPSGKARSTAALIGFALNELHYGRGLK